MKEVARVCNFFSCSVRLVIAGVVWAEPAPHSIVQELIVSIVGRPALYPACLENLRNQSRNGAFQFERSGHLVTADGAFLMGYPQSQQSNLEPLQVPLDFCNLTIEGDGKVMGTQINGDGKPVQLGQVVLGQVDDGSWLDRNGSHLARNAYCGALRTAVPGQDGLGVVAQGYLEYSNVNPLQQVRILSALTNYADLLGLPVFDQYLP